MNPATFTNRRRCTPVKTRAAGVVQTGPLTTGQVHIVRGNALVHMRAGVLHPAGDGRSPQLVVHNTGSRSSWLRTGPRAVDPAAGRRRVPVDPRTTGIVNTG